MIPLKQIQPFSKKDYSGKEILLKRFSCLSLSLSLLAGVASAQLQTVEEFTTKSGISVWLIEDHSAPTFDVELSFYGGGSVYDPKGKEGVSEVASALFGEGAGSYSSHEFKKELKDNSIVLSFQTGKEFFYASVYGLSKYKEKAWSLLSLSLNEPSFEAQSIERIKQQAYVGLEAEERDPSTLAARAFRSQAYGEHPFSSYITKEALEVIGQSDLQKFQQKLPTFEMRVVATGDTTREELERLLESHFARKNLKDSKESFKPIEPVSVQAFEPYKVDWPTPQTFIRFGHEALALDDPDRYAAILLNHILGGGAFSSRLYNVIRKEKGLTYGITTGLNTTNKLSVIQGSVSTKTASAQEVKDLILENWKLIADKGVTAKELEDAKSYLSGAFVLSFTTNRAIATQYLHVQTLGMTPEDVALYKERLNAVSLEDAQRVAKKLFLPEKLSFVSVGE